MKSTVSLTRETTATVTIEHPDEWGEAEIRSAVATRAIDIAAAAPFWCADVNRTTVTAITIDDEAEMPEGMMMERPSPVGLTDDDLT